MGCSWHIPEAFTESQKPQREANQKKMHVVLPGSRPVCAMDILMTAPLIHLQCACLWEVPYLFQLWESSG